MEWRFGGSRHSAISANAGKEFFRTLMKTHPKAGELNPFYLYSPARRRSMFQRRVEGFGRVPADFAGRLLEREPAFSEMSGAKMHETRAKAEQLARESIDNLITEGAVVLAQLGRMVLPVLGVGNGILVYSIVRIYSIHEIGFTGFGVAALSIGWGLCSLIVALGIAMHYLGRRQVIRTGRELREKVNLLVHGGSGSSPALPEPLQQ